MTRNKTIVHVDRAKNVEFRENIEKIRLIGKIFQPVFCMRPTLSPRHSLRVEKHLRLEHQDFDTTRKKKQEIPELKMNIENGKFNFLWRQFQQKVTNL